MLRGTDDRPPAAIGVNDHALSARIRRQDAKLAAGLTMTAVRTGASGGDTEDTRRFEQARHPENESQRGRARQDGQGSHAA
jgi:hypothetical protein